jgi:hypothetical protein
MFSLSNRVELTLYFVIHVDSYNGDWPIELNVTCNYRRILIKIGHFSYLSLVQLKGVMAKYKLILTFTSKNANTGSIIEKKVTNI